MGVHPERLTGTGGMMDGAVETILENKNNKLALRWAADLSGGAPLLPPAHP